MTSELKPCPFCGGKADPEGWSSIDRKGPACDDCYASADTIERWNTRATPSADPLAGLVRYDKGDILLALEGGYDPLPSDDGEYVLYSAAATIIEKLTCPKYLEEKLNQIGLVDKEWQSRAETAEAELAHIKAQEPVGYIHQHPDHENEFILADESHYRLTEQNKKHGWLEIPIYAAPVSDSLKAENDRLRKLVTEFSKQHLTDEMELEDQFSADFEGAYDVFITKSRAALNVEESNDKG